MKVLLILFNTKAEKSCVAYPIVVYDSPIICRLLIKNFLARTEIFQLFGSVIEEMKCCYETCWSHLSVNFFTSFSIISAIFLCLSRCCIVMNSAPADDGVRPVL